MNWVTRAVELVWGLWALLLFALACISSLLIALLVPGTNRRQRWVSQVSRLTFFVAGVDVTVRGLDHLPPDACVVVANHASYVDGVLLNAYLPAEFAFVIKGEIRRVPVVHFVLRRTGSRFVERSERNAIARDTREIVRAAKSGASLGFFPEGTFAKTPGIRRFRAGAFLAAGKAQMPVVPIAIRGTRGMLPAGRTLPRRVPLIIDILPAIAPGDDHYGDSKKLAETARQRILAIVGEPDLAGPATT